MRYVSVVFLAVALSSVSLGQEQPVSSADTTTVASDNFVRKTKFFPDVTENKEPPSTEKKFRLFALQSVSPANIGVAAAVAGWGQARNRPEGYGQGGEGYGKRFGASMAMAASTSFFGTFLIPSLSHQDPRFHRQGSGSFGQSVKYGLRHVVVTKNDNGSDAFNWSGILAPVAAQSLANAYLPDHERTVGKTLIRSGRTIGLTVGLNVLKEYWPTISRKMSHRSRQ